MSITEDLDTLEQAIEDQDCWTTPMTEALIRIRDHIQHLERGAALLRREEKACGGPDSRFHHWRADIEDWLKADTARRGDR